MLNLCFFAQFAFNLAPYSYLVFADRASLTLKTLPNAFEPICSQTLSNCLKWVLL